MKKWLCGVLAAVMVFSLAACGGTSNAPAATAGESESATENNAADLKVGMIYVGDETDGYSAAHMEGVANAMKNLGMTSDQLVVKTKVTEDSSCYEAAVDLVGQGCNLIISNSYGHQTFMVQAAMEYPDVTFVSMTGDFAALSGCENFHNAFTNIFEARYVSGVVAGMKVKELLEDGTISPEATPEHFDADGNVKIGYVGAFNYAEIVSGYTSFYLGVKSVVPNVAMEVLYTNSWGDVDKEAAAAEALVANGNVIIGQHADSTGAPSATQKLLNDGKICYSVGYNIDMLATAPTAALTSPTNNWEVYYTHAFETVAAGEELEVDWAKGFAEDAVGITALGEACAEGTAEKVDEVIAQLKDGSLKVFDTANFTVDGKAVDSAMIDLSFMDFSSNPPSVIYQGETLEAIKDGEFVESVLRSAPYFALRIDGITEDADAVE